MSVLANFVLGKVSDVSTPSQQLAEKGYSHHLPYCILYTVFFIFFLTMDEFESYGGCVTDLWVANIACHCLIIQGVIDNICFLIQIELLF